MTGSRCGRHESFVLKLGLFTRAYSDRSLEKALDKAVELGLEAVEIPCGNYDGIRHCDPKALLGDPKKLKRFEGAIRDRGLVISTLSVHGNPLHPSREIAKAHIQAHHNTILLAEKLGIERVTVLSGCPGDSNHAKYPNWVSFGVLDECQELLSWQWPRWMIGHVDGWCHWGKVISPLRLR